MLNALLAILPILLLFILMIIFRWPAIRAMPASWALTIILAILHWNMNINAIIAANMKGLLVTIDIIIILLGAIFLLEVLKQAKIISKIDNLLRKVSPDKRVSLIIIAWSFVCLIEGAAGFGTPAALAAPLLVSLGIAPVAAVSLALMADSTAVSFGALGTPINIGIVEVLPDLSTSMLAQITQNTALIHSIVGMTIPFILVLALTIFEKKPIRTTLPLLPFCIFAAASFVIPYFIVANILGPTFPSLVGGVISIILVFEVARRGWLLPKQKRKKEIKLKKAMFAFSPYVLATALLIVVNSHAVSEVLGMFSVSFENMMQTQISHSFAPLMNPGSTFALSAIIFALYTKLPKNKIQKCADDTIQRAKYTFVALAFTIGLVQTFLWSSYNLEKIESMPIAIANALSEIFGQTYIFAAPQIGAFGSFVSGSNTVSNLFFAPFQYEAAIALGISVATVLALQVVGGAAGNMIAVHNIIAASATVNLRGEEGKIISMNVILTIAYALFASLLAILILR